MYAQRRLTPMGIGDILDETFKLLRENFVVLTGIVALLQVPLTIFTSVLTNVYINGDLQTNLRRVQDASKQAQQSGSTVDTSTITGPLVDVAKDIVLLLAVTLPLTFLVTSVISAAVAIGISERYLDRPISIGACYRRALPRLLPLTGMIILLGLILGTIVVGPGLLLLLARSPGLAVVAFILGALVDVFLWVRWALLTQVVVLEGRGLSALGRSFQLTGDYWWKVFGTLVIAAVLVGILGGIAGALSGGVLGAINVQGTPRSLIQSAVSAVVTIVTTPISLGAQTLLFYDLKVRKEAFDLEALATGLMLPTAAL